VSPPLCLPGPKGTKLPVTPFPMPPDAFFRRFPEFAATDLSLITATLDDAALQIDVNVWGNLAGTGHGYLTAHMLALSPFGQAARLVAKDGTTTYQTHYNRLVRMVAPGFRVL
jgi:Protein of unknown function (DUF4054)